MKLSKWIVAMLIFSIITLSGCTSYNDVYLHQQQLKNQYTYYKIAPPLYARDVVQLTHKDGSRDSVTVQSTTPHEIVSTTGQTVELSDITSLKRKEFSTWKTVGLVGAGVGATLVIFSIAFVTLLTKGVAAALFAA